MTISNHKNTHPRRTQILACGLWHPTERTCAVICALVSRMSGDVLDDDTPPQAALLSTVSVLKTNITRIKQAEKALPPGFITTVPTNVDALPAGCLRRGYSHLAAVPSLARIWATLSSIQRGRCSRTWMHTFGPHMLSRWLQWLTVMGRICVWFLVLPDVINHHDQPLLSIVMVNHVYQPSWYIISIKGVDKPLLSAIPWNHCHRLLPTTINHDHSCPFQVVENHYQRILTHRQLGMFIKYQLVSLLSITNHDSHSPFAVLSHHFYCQHLNIIVSLN